MTQTATKTQKTVQVIARYTLKRNGHVIYAVRSSNGVDQYQVLVIGGVVESCSCPAHGHCYHKRGIQIIEENRREAEMKKEQVVTCTAPQFEEGQEVLYSYCPGLVFTGIIAGSRTRLNGEDGYKLQTKFWTEVVPVRFLTSKATQQVEIEQQQETPAATPELVETHRVSRVDGIVTRWYPEYRQGTEWFRYPQPDGNRAVSFVIEGRAETWLSERLAAVAEVKAERKMAAFKAGPDYDTLAVTKTTAAEREAKQREVEETAASYMRHFYDEY